MKNRKPLFEVTGRWQHLEFFQWFSQRFNATQVKVSTTCNNVTVKTTPQGIALAYSKARGAELMEKLSDGRFAHFNRSHYQEGSGSHNAPRYHRAIPPDLPGRIAHWKQIIPPDTDIRKRAVLAILLAHTPNAIHPSRRR